MILRSRGKKRLPWSICKEGNRRSASTMNRNNPRERRNGSETNERINRGQISRIIMRKNNPKKYHRPGSRHRRMLDVDAVDDLPPAEVDRSIPSARIRPPSDASLTHLVRTRLVSTNCSSHRYHLFAPPVSSSYFTMFNITPIFFFFN